ncbi:hypothetical protein BU15DRAFT_75998 [Melanogaster broomeanus]|nr:hypothetical protein BU15DRAFT_75998 [Melanogaster broomeanus]
MSTSGPSVPVLVLLPSSALKGLSGPLYVYARPAVSSAKPNSRSSTPSALPVAGSPSTSPTPSSSASPMPSLSVSIPTSEQRDTVTGCIRRDRTHKVAVGQPKLSSLPPNHPRRRTKLWYDALMRKQALIKQLFEEQRLIEEVEDEASLHLPRDTIAHFRSLHVGPQDLSSPLGRFTSAVSNVSASLPSLPSQ